MHKELKRYSTIGNKAGILLLCRNVLSGHQSQIASIRTTCSFVYGCELNLNCGLLAFEALNLIKIQDGSFQTIEPLFASYSEDDAINHLCKICFSFLMESDLVQIERLKFNVQADLFYIPKSAFSLQSSVFRNLLISLGAIVPYETEFRITKSYDDFFQNLVKKIHRKISLAELQNKLIQEQEMGEQGELFVLQFEKSRCNFPPILKSRIRQISHVDVSAGYDIISFNDISGASHRYIEVKTYKGKPHFYWSANEIESAKLRGADYCIYLVDYDKINTPDYIPEIIQDPFTTIQHSEIWASSPSSYLVEKI